MKKNIRKFIVPAVAAVIAIGAAMTANAQSVGEGMWVQENGAYKYQLNPAGTSFANGWQWIKDTDGTVRCYYFDDKGTMAASITVDESILDAEGRWIVDGIVQTAAEAEKAFFTTVEKFTINGAGPSGAAVSGINQTATHDADVAAEIAKGTPTKKIHRAYLGKAINLLANTSAYTTSAVDGMKVVNEWANFSADFSSIGGTLINATPDAIDFSVTKDGASLVVRYAPLDYFTAGNTDLGAFASSFVKSRDGLTGGNVAGNVTLGAYNFLKLTKTVKVPYGSYDDATYLRVLDGTNFVQIISINQHETGNDFMSALNTIARVR